MAVVTRKAALTRKKPNKAHKSIFFDLPSKKPAFQRAFSLNKAHVEFLDLFGFHQCFCRIQHLAAIAPLVVIPRKNLHQLTVF